MAPRTKYYCHMMSATWHLVQEERDTTRDTTRPSNISEHKYIRESNVIQIPLYQQV
jgi:hypothetical protein